MIDDFTVSDSETAGKILHYLGWAVEPSLEGGMDRRRDHIARLIRAHIESENAELERLKKLKAGVK